MDPTDRRGAASRVINLMAQSFLGRNRVQNFRCYSCAPVRGRGMRMSPEEDSEQARSEGQRTRKGQAALQMKRWGRTVKPSLM